MTPCVIHNREPMLTGRGYVCPLCEAKTISELRSIAEQRAREQWEYEQMKKLKATQP